MGCTKDLETSPDEISTEQSKVSDEHHLRTIICEPSPIDLPDGCGCFAPPVNCLITVPIRGSIAADLEILDNAIDNDDVTTYFASGMYKSTLPKLDDYPNYVLDLKNGVKTIRQVGASNPDETIYVLIDSMIASSFEDKDIILAFPFEN